MATLHDRIIATITNRRCIIQCSRCASIFTRVLLCMSCRRAKGACSSSRWCQTVCCSSIHFPSSLSTFSLSVFREETTLPARPQEHMFTNNKSRRMLLKNQQTERITPPRFDRHSLNWFILSCCPTDAIRFLFSVGSGCRTVEGRLVTVYIVCPRLNNFIPLYKWGTKSNDI